MPAEISITDDDVAFAENILFSHGEKFDDERIDFINNLDTIDLQAVPGSGKTTALMAKLLILERYLPLDDGSGILVISHTNAAVDEIKNKIGKYCPELFSCPNFIGTIQSFTDRFLAIPFYVNWNKSKLFCIDDDIFNDMVERFYFSLDPRSGIKFWIDKKRDPIKFLQDLRFDAEMNLADQVDGKIVLKSERDSRTYRALKRNKLSWLRSGILNYDDAYFFANIYLKKYQKIKTILQKRFQFVFVDEMQDMDKQQHDLLEKIFYDDSVSASKYQRVGDKNQAIFSHNMKLDEVWSKRDTLTINGSHRLTQPIAELVNCFALHRDAGFQVRGLRKGEILPHLIVYDDASIGKVIEKYSEIINKLLNKEKIPSSDENKFKAIAWRKFDPGKDKIYMNDYYPKFDAIKHSNRIDYSCLGDYLNANHKTKNSLAPIQADIINALVKVLRLENIETEDGRKHTKYSLQTYLREHHEESLDEFKLNLFQWSMALAQGRDVINLVRTYIPNFLALFTSAINHSNKFINAESRYNNGGVLRDEVRKTNTKNYHGFDIEMTTIHAEKGKNHTATLYLETFYSKGKGNYETERLKDQFLFKNFDPNTLDVVKQSAKMMYVGISRPTHLLCVAVHKDRFDENLSEINSDKWEVIIL
jgi:DNA helicase II / ATP-dependent DNA helicase PcrA